LQPCCHHGFRQVVNNAFKIIKNPNDDLIDELHDLTNSTTWWSSRRKKAHLKDSVISQRDEKPTRTGYTTEVYLPLKSSADRSAGGAQEALQ
jgi:hypothetical protein